MNKLTRFFEDVYKLSHFKEDTIGGLVHGILLCEPRNVDELYASIIIRLENFGRDTKLKDRDGTDIIDVDSFVSSIDNDINARTVQKLDELGIDNAP